MERTSEAPPTFLPGQLIYNDRALLADSSVENADKMGKETYNEPMRRKTGPFLIGKVNEHTLTIDENGTQNTVSFQREKLAFGQTIASPTLNSPLYTLNQAD